MLDPLSVDSYGYELPSSLIASYPAKPPDSCRLLVYDRKKDKIIHAIFRDIVNYLPKDTNVVFNDTKVIKARIYGKKSTGGKIELLLNSPLQNDRFLVYIRGKVKIDTILFFENALSAKVVSINSDGTREVEFYQNSKKLNFEKVVRLLDAIGHVPLPPYIKREDEKSDVSNYQSLFAKKEGAVAAPTASLHFTPTLTEELKKRFDTFFLTLHVGAGTFKPVEVENINDHKMHSEIFDIPNDTKELIESCAKILAVGTTVTRTIEYYTREKKSFGKADIFLHPKNPPIRVDSLLTNFHLPKSTLLMLVASFLGIEKTMEIYKTAIEKGYKFFSYGDAMLII